MKKFLTIFLLFCLIESFGQNYFEYQKIFNSIDNDILSNNLSTALKRLDTVYNSYNFIYAKHCIKALQISCVQNDSINADKWLKKCFVQGVPLWLIRNNDITSKVFRYGSINNTLKLYDSLQAVYRASINIKVLKTIDSLILIDQAFTNKVNNGFILFRHTIYGLQWLNNNKKQFKIINDIIDRYGFPGERLIGFSNQYQDSSESFKNIGFYGPKIEEYRTYIMLIHYFSSSRKSITEKLLLSVRDGFLPSYQYGAINDFIALYCKKENGNYYNIWHFDTEEQNLSKINFRRQLIGLSEVEEQKRNNQINNERRKNKTINKTILLE